MSDILLYEVIDAGSARAFIEKLNATNGPVTVRINSGGGSVFEGLAIYNAIQRHGKVTIKIDGLAASIASLIAMGGKTVEMAENALMMIHNPWSWSEGDSVQLRKQADLLDKCKETMITAYTNRTGRSGDEISALMDHETWFTAEEAQNFKLIDAIYEPPAMAASYCGIEKFNLPERIKKMTQAVKSEHQETKRQNKANTVGDPEAIRAEQQRQKDIRSSFSLFKNKFQSLDLQSLMDDCINDPDISASAASKILMVRLGRDSEPTGNFGCRIGNEGYLENNTPTNFSHNSNGDFLQAAQDALLLRNGVKVADPHPAARDLRNMGIPEIARNLLRINHDYGASNYSSRDAVIKAMTTTSDFPLLLANVGGKSLREGYMMAPITCREWAAEREVPDFKEQTLAMLSSAPELLEVKEGGEYKYGAFSESANTFKIKKWGRIFSITREALINDDLSAFTRLPFAFGQRSAALESDEVYSLLTSTANLADGSPLFDASRGNLASSGSALSVTALGAARSAMRKQKGLDGKTVIDIQPRYLIVPSDLETDGEQLLSSLVDPSKTNDTSNPGWIRSLTLVADPRLTGTAWYLASSPNQVESIIRAFLAGEERPYTEEKTGFEVDDYSIKARLEFAAAVIDPKGLYKNPGA